MSAIQWKLWASNNEKDTSLLDKWQRLQKGSLLSFSSKHCNICVINKKKPYHNDEELQQNLQQSSSSSRQLAYIKPSWRVTISSWSARPFFSCVVLWSHFTSCGWMPDTDVVWRSQSVDKSTVNRDSSVAEASFNLKLDLISQMHIVWNCGQCITRLGNNL